MGYLGIITRSDTLSHITAVLNFFVNYLVALNVHQVSMHLLGFSRTHFEGLLVGKIEAIVTFLG